MRSPAPPPATVLTATAALLVLLLAALLGACAPPTRDAGTGTRPGPAPTTRTAPAPDARDPASGLRWIDAADLPREAGPVLTRIAQGGPFRSQRDDVTFMNRERILPTAPRGTYREYTVPTPGASTRGARRIVCAAPRRSTAECYYTADHYTTFRRIRP